MDTWSLAFKILTHPLNTQVKRPLFSDANPSLPSRVPYPPVFPLHYSISHMVRTKLELPGFKSELHYFLYGLRRITQAVYGSLSGGTDY